MSSSSWTAKSRSLAAPALIPQAVIAGKVTDEDGDPFPGSFVQLYRDGLIYKGRYVVNWCPGCRTAVSDLEVIEKKTKGTLYKIRYDVSGVPGGAVVATTRPETMLGDTALAIHPDDPRNAGLRGKRALLPIVGRELPVIEQDHDSPLSHCVG